MKPILLKAGDPRLKINGNAPKVDCRIIAEENYQELERKANHFNALVSLQTTDSFKKWLDKYFKHSPEIYYITKNGSEIFSLKQLYKNYERAMKETPFAT